MLCVINAARYVVHGRELHSAGGTYEGAGLDVPVLINSLHTTLVKKHKRLFCGTGFFFLLLFYFLISNVLKDVMFYVDAI